MTDSKRVAAAKAADLADLARAVRQLIRTPQDLADWMIAEYEAATGMMATAEDRAYALQCAMEGSEP